MYNPLKYLLLSGAILAASQSIASTIDYVSVFKITPAKTSVVMAPGSNTTLDFTVSNNMSVDLKVTDVRPLSNMSNLNVSITTDNDNCTGVTLTKDNGNSCSVTASITAANVTRKTEGYFDITACIDGGAHCSASTVKAKFTIDPNITTTLTRSFENLALSVNDTGTSAALTGNPRIVTITNTGAETTSNLAVTSAALPTGTTISNDCPATLAIGATCTVTITPGATASSDGASACTANGTAPQASVITVSADNATSVTSNVFVLGYGCRYQSGLLYSVDDTIANTGSIGGKVAGLTDVSASQRWTSSDTSSISNAVSETEGAKNTDAIVVHSSCISNIFTTDRCAAYNCRNNYTEGGYTNWYLPAICEMGTVRGSASCTGNPSQQNMQENLVNAPSVPGAPSGSYWSSTGSDTGAAQKFAFFQTFQSIQSNSNNSTTNKFSEFRVRCSRALSP